MTLVARCYLPLRFLRLLLLPLVVRTTRFHYWWLLLLLFAKLKSRKKTHGPRAMMTTVMVTIVTNAIQIAATPRGALCCLMVYAGIVAVAARPASPGAPLR